MSDKHLSTNTIKYYLGAKHRSRQRVHQHTASDWSSLFDHLISVLTADNNKVAMAA